MEEKKPYVFGVPVNTGKPKKKKITVTEKEIENQQDGYYCKDRVKHNHFLCDNKTCKCQFKKYSVKNIELEINKSIIIKYFTDNKIKNKYTDMLLNSEWKTDKLKNRFGKMIYDFLYQCKFVYDLDLIIEEKVIDKTATETYTCKERIPHNFFFCSGRYIIENDIEKKLCRCSFSYFTEDQLQKEVMRELFIKNKDKLKLTKWEKIIVTFNWNNLSDKQGEMYNRLILKYMNKLSKLNTPPTPLTRKVKRKKITP